MRRNSIFYSYGLIILIGAVLFIPFLGGVHLFDWDEINFAESAREMIVTGNYLDVQINYKPFWEKPPLFIWMQLLSMKIFGINEFAARFPNALCGIISLIVIFGIGLKLRDEKFARLWVLSYAGSVLPFFYFKSGIIDPWFNFFIFSGIVSFVLYLNEYPGRYKNLSISALCIGLAILTKGPVALLIFIISFVAVLCIKKFTIKTSFRDVLLFTVILVLTGGFWFILQILSGNYQLIQDFISYQIRLFSTKDAGHGGFVLYHVIVLLLGVFPASVFAIPVLKIRKNEDDDMHIWMLVLLYTVLVLFTIVKTKIVHYSSLCYYPLAFFSAVFLHEYIYGKRRLTGFLRVMILCIAGMFGLMISAIPLLEKYKTLIISRGWIKDSFTQANLMAEVSWTGFEPLLGLGFIILIWFFLNKSRMNSKKHIIGIFVSTLIFVYISILILVPRIEAHSQRAAIEFYKSVSDEDAYIATMDFKSYAHLYYGRVKPYQNSEASQLEWLLNKSIDKPAYFVFKINNKEKYLSKYPQLKLLYEKNGFVFTRRTISNNQ